VWTIAIISSNVASEDFEDRLSFRGGGVGGKS
jgi:hypothetical protein